MCKDHCLHPTADEILNDLDELADRAIDQLIAQPLEK